MNTKITAAAVAGSMAVGGLAGAWLATPLLAGAAQDDQEESRDEMPDDSDFQSWYEDVLDDLVADGTLMQEQADTVSDALTGARAERPRMFRMFMSYDLAAETIGISREDLRDALGEGSTIAEVAEQNGVEPQAIIEALVAELESVLAEQVDKGDLTQEEADSHLADATERITEMVNEGGPFIDRQRHHHRFGPRHDRPEHMPLPPMKPDRLGEPDNRDDSGS